jgi:hypothetical protein
MSDDDISRRILEGSAYEQAVVTVRRTFPVGLEWKIYIALGILATAGLIAPALFVRRAYVSAVTGAESLSAALSPTVVTLSFVGVLVTAATGAILVRQQYVVSRRSLDEERARRLVRVEDVLMWFLLQGAALVAVPTAVSLLAVVSTGAVETLYATGIKAFGPAGAVGVDARLVSGLGVTLAVVLFAASSWARSVT